MQNLGQTFAETEEQLKQLEQISEKCKALKEESGTDCGAVAGTGKKRTGKRTNA